MNTLDPNLTAPVDTPPAAPVDPTPPAAAVPADPPAAPDPPKHTIKWNGQEHQLTQEELIEKAQMGFDYTQKAQHVAQQRKLVEQVAAVLASEKQRVDQLLSNREALARHLESLAPPPDAPAPDEVPTIEQAQALIKEQVEAARKAILEDVESKQFALENARMVTHFRSEIDTSIKDIAGKFPVLSEYLEPEDVAGLLRSAAAKFVNDAVQSNPQEAVPITAVKDAMVKAATARVTKIEKKIADQRKMQVVRDAKLTKEGIEAPGGTAPPPVAPVKHKLGSKELTQSVIEELNAAFSKA